MTKKLPVVFPLATTLCKRSQRNNGNNKAKRVQKAIERLTKQYLNERMEDIRREVIAAVSNGLYSITICGADNNWFVHSAFLNGLRAKLEHRGFVVTSELDSDDKNYYTISWLNPNKDIINERRAASKRWRDAQS